MDLGSSQVVLLVKNLPANAGDVRDRGLIPGLGRFPGGGNGNLFQYFCLENPMDKEAWWATAHSVAKSRTRLKRLSTYACRWTGELVFKNEACPGDSNMHLGLGPSTSQSLTCMWITWALALKYTVYRGGRF